MKVLPRSFYQRKTLTVAKDLLGKLLVREYRGKKIIGRITEVEAYLHDDPASHSYRGQTQRNQSMFLEGGTAYVYFIYGMHFCFNVVTESRGKAEAVLIRSVEPIQGIPPKRFTNGPGKLAKAFHINKKWDGVSLKSKSLFIADDGFRLARKTIRVSGRIGISKNVEKEWRFFI